MLRSAVEIAIPCMVLADVLGSTRLASLAPMTEFRMLGPGSLACSGTRTYPY